MQLHRRDLGPVKRGEIVRLRVQWDQNNHRFIFQRDDAPEVLAPYAVSDTAPPGNAVKLLDAMLFVPNCTATPRPVAFIEAWFDDIMVNESAAPRAERWTLALPSPTRGRGARTVSLSRRERIDTPRKDIAEVTGRLDRIEKHILAEQKREIEDLKQRMKRLEDVLAV
jgi:hypothetical protein